MAAALEAYIDDAALRQRHGRHGRERVESRFSLATMIRAYDSEYRALAASIPYVIPHERSVDIDEPLQLAWAEFLLSNVLQSS